MEKKKSDIEQIRFMKNKLAKFPIFCWSYYCVVCVWSSSHAWPIFVIPPYRMLNAQAIYIKRNTTATMMASWLKLLIFYRNLFPLLGWNVDKDKIIISKPEDLEAGYGG